MANNRKDKKLSQAQLKKLIGDSTPQQQKVGKSKKQKMPKFVTNDFGVEIPIKVFADLKRKIDKENRRREQELKYLQGLKARINGVIQKKRNGEDMKVTDFSDVEAGQANLKFSDFKPIDFDEKINNIRYPSELEQLRKITDNYSSVAERFDSYKENYVKAVVDQWGSSGDTAKVLDAIAKTPSKIFAEKYYSEPTWGVLNVTYIYPDDSEDMFSELYNYWVGDG